MKILHIISSFEGGGAEKLVLQLHELSLAQGIDSHAVSITSSFARGLPNTYSLGCKNPYDLLTPFKLYLFLSQPQWNDLSIIHTHLFPSQLFTSLVSFFVRLKPVLVTTEHNTSNRRRNKPFAKLFDKFLYSFYEKIICISDGTLQSLIEFQPQLSKKTSIIYNGISISEYLPRRDYCALNSRVPVIISVARLVKQKNYQVAILALSKIYDQDFEYWIVGTGPLEKSLRELVHSLNLESKVKFLGFRNDVPSLLHQADIFLLTSCYEGFGLAVVEAMASGLPVIVSNVIGVREVVIDEKEGVCNVGLLVNPLSENDIACALEKMLKNQALIIEMSKKAYLRSLLFDINKTVNEHIALYYSLS